MVKLTGDRAPVEFPSVVDAVRCAVDIQRGMADRNDNVPIEKRIEFRVDTIIAISSSMAAILMALASMWLLA
jgi:class 3 adenylate cyclase